MFQQLLQEDFRMLQVVSTGAYYPPVDTTWKILTTGASQLTAGALCTVLLVRLAHLLVSLVLLALLVNL